MEGSSVLIVEEIPNTNAEDLLNVFSQEIIVTVYSVYEREHILLPVSQQIRSGGIKSASGYDPTSADPIRVASKYPYALIYS